MDFKNIIVGNRNIIIGGIGKLFFQEGTPISITISEIKKKGYEISIFHIADECIRNGWSPKTTYNRLVADFEDDIDNNFIDLIELKKFCDSSYEDQREMIFQFLFNIKSKDAISKIEDFKIFLLKTLIYDKQT